MGLTPLSPAVSSTGWATAQHVLITFAAAQHLSPLPRFGEMATASPTSLYRSPKTQMCVFPTPAILLACQVTPSGTQVWMRDREKHKSFRFHFITRAMASRILSAGWQWYRVESSSPVTIGSHGSHLVLIRPHLREDLSASDPSASPSSRSASCLPGTLAINPLSV